MNAYTLSAIVVFMYFTAVFLWAQKIDNYSIVDIGWGLGFSVIAWVKYLAYPQSSSLLLTLLVTLWSLRLFIHIARRNIGKAEDYRYTEMRQTWGKSVKLQAYFKVFMLQGLLQYFVALAIIGSGGMVSNEPLVVLGVSIFFFGLIFETIGDQQLRNFLKTRTDKSKIMDKGLWKYTRHPNYFGEALLWWGFYMAALSYGAPIFTIIAPITITVLVRYVSGVPILERRYKDNANFQQYAKKTSVFIPMPPKR